MKELKTKSINCHALIAFKSFIHSDSIPEVISVLAILVLVDPCVIVSRIDWKTVVWPGTNNVLDNVKHAGIIMLHQITAPLIAHPVIQPRRITF